MVERCYDTGVRETIISQYGQHGQRSCAGGLEVTEDLSVSTPSRRTRSASWALSLLLISMSFAAVNAAQGAGLVPHVARYILTRHRADSDSGIVAVRGRMEVRFEISCDGYQIDQYLGFRMLSESERQLEHLAYISSFEDAQGRDYWFNTKTFEDRKLSEEIGGKASLNPSGEGETRYTRPSRTVEPLPKGTLFPIKHLEAIIDAARKGQQSVRHTVFDGSTRDNPFEISTFIGRPDSSSTKALHPLRDLAHWPVRLAYFSVGALNPVPEFQMSADLFENGIIGNMVYDYGNFAIGVELDEVEVLPKPEC